MDISHLQCLIVVAGISGAGKSKALNAVADRGFFTIENLPVSMLKEFLEFTKNDPSRYHRLAVLPDITSTDKARELLKIVSTLEPKGRAFNIFLGCADEVIIRRYSETRRPHPSFDAERDKSLEDAIKRERSRLTSYREKAHLLLDTSTWSIHDLRREITSFIESINVEDAFVLRLNFLSFGFRHGIPGDCDMVLDARFLPNPFFVPELKEKDGLDQDVASYVLENPLCQQFLEKYTDILRFLLPLYAHGGKTYINVGIGCTGGKHRSVAIAQELAKRFQDPSYYVSAKHRDKEKVRQAQ